MKWPKLLYQDILSRIPTPRGSPVFTGKSKGQYHEMARFVFFYGLNQIFVDWVHHMSLLHHLNYQITGPTYKLIKMFHPRRQASINRCLLPIFSMDKHGRDVKNPHEYGPTLDNRCFRVRRVYAQCLFLNIFSSQKRLGVKVKGRIIIQLTR